MPNIKHYGKVTHTPFTIDWNMVACVLLGMVIGYIIYLSWVAVPPVDIQKAIDSGGLIMN